MESHSDFLLAVTSLFYYLQYRHIFYHNFKGSVIHFDLGNFEKEKKMEAL